MIQTFEDALELVVSVTKHTRFRELCDPNHPDYNPGYRDSVLRLAAHYSGVDPFPPQPKPVFVPNIQANTTQKPKATLSPEERLSICKSCPHFEPQMPMCKLCGCNLTKKVQNPHDQCPISKW